MAQSVSLENFQIEERPVVKHQLLRSMVNRLQLKRLAMQGLPATKAAQLVGLNPETVRGVYRDPSFRTEVLQRVDEAFTDVDQRFTQRRKTLHERLEEQAERSFDELLDLVHDEAVHPGVKVRIHQDFLNRSAQAAPIKTTINFDAMFAQTAQVATQELNNILPFRKGA